MAQYSKKKSAYRPSHDDLHEAVMLSDQDGNIISTSGTLANMHIATGKLEGYEMEHVIGAVPSMSQNTSGTIWDINDRDYPFDVLETPSNLTITCGAEEVGHSVMIEGLDSLGEHFSEEVVLTSTTTTTSTSWTRIHYAYYKDSSVTSNTNDILFSIGAPVTLTTDPGFNIVAKILAGRGKTSMGTFTVPKDHTAFITKGVATCAAAADATIDMFVKFSDQTNFVVHHSFEIAGVGGQYNYDFSVPLKIPELTDIDIRGTVRSNNARITCAFDIIMIHNSVL